MKTAVLTIALMIFCFCTPHHSDLQVRDNLRSILDNKLKDWNDNTIEDFMKSYWKSEELTFQSGNRRLQGWEALLTMYKTNYPGEKRGRLDFTDIKIKVLSSETAYVIGRWAVIHPDTTKTGLFTLIFRKFSGGWKIIHDHSS